MTAPTDTIAPEETAPTVEVGTSNAAGEIPLVFPVLVIEGLDTSDGRYLTPGSLSPRALPLSLLAQPESAHGGDEPGAAVVVGRIDTLVRKPGPEVISKRTGQPFPEGTFVWTGTGVMLADAVVRGYNIADLVKRRLLRGISVDLVGMEFEVLGADGPLDPANPSRELVTHAAEIAAATLVPIPAFGDAYVELTGDDGPVEPVTADDLPDGLMASAVPSWRSSEVGDACVLCAAGLLADDQPYPAAIPADAVDQLAKVIGDDGGEQRDATALASAIVDYITAQWASGDTDTPMPDDEPLPAAVTAAADDGPHTGGMIALVPSNADDLAVDGGDPTGELHLTLAYLGDDVTDWTDEQRAGVHDLAGQIASTLGRPAQADVMGHAAFNPTGANGREPAAVYLASGEDLPALKSAVDDYDVGDHPVFLPHITAGYGLDPSALSYIGPVSFDRLRVALADQVTDYPLGDTSSAELPADDETVADPAAATEQLADAPGEYPGGEYPEDEEGYDEVGLPDAPQPCQYGDHPATHSLLYDDGHQYVPVCDPDDQQARDHIAANGGEVTAVVPINNDISQPEQPDAEPSTVVASAARRGRRVDPRWTAPITAAAPMRAPAAWFADPQLDGPTALHVDEDGRVYGHLAAWDVPHIGMPNQRITAPRSPSGYAYFRTGAVLADDGTEVPVGHITLDTGHAGTELGHHAAASHYDSTGTVVADVAAGEDAYGIWVAGAMRSGVPDEATSKLRASALSGDWRRIGSSLELVAALAVNVPGFPIPRARARVASGVPQALVAAGAVRPPAATDLTVGKLTTGTLTAGTLTHGTLAATEQLADAIAERIERRQRDAALAGEHASLVADLDDSPALVASLIDELDDTAQLAAALLADLDDDATPEDIATLAELAADDTLDEDAFVSRMPPQLRESYLHGKVAARIGWGAPGDFNRCVAQAKAHGVPARMQKGMCATLHKQATGVTPGHPV